MESKPSRLKRDDWIRGAFDVLVVQGMDGVKIVPLARRLGVTSGSFYWHFKNRRELLDGLLEYWEREMTDTAIETAKRFEGPANNRIWNLMEQVMTERLARFDLAIWHWAQSDLGAQKAFRRSVNKRFAFAKWLFKEAGFSSIQAEARSRLMVVYMMGETTLVPDSLGKRRKHLRLKYEILMGP